MHLEVDLSYFYSYLKLLWKSVGEYSVINITYGSCKKVNIYPISIKLSLNKLISLLSGKHFPLTCISMLHFLLHAFFNKSDPDMVVSSSLKYTSIKSWLKKHAALYMHSVFLGSFTIISLKGLLIHLLCNLLWLRIYHIFLCVCAWFTDVRKINITFKIFKSFKTFSMHRNKDKKTLSSYYNLKHNQNGFKNLIGRFKRIFSQETDSNTL